MATVVVDAVALWFQPWPAAVSCLVKRGETNQMLQERPTLPSASRLFLFLLQLCLFEAVIFLAAFSQKVVQKAFTK